MPDIAANPLMADELACLDPAENHVNKVVALSNEQPVDYAQTLTFFTHCS